MTDKNEKKIVRIVGKDVDYSAAGNQKFIDEMTKAYAGSSWEIILQVTDGHESIREEDVAAILDKEQSVSLYVNEAIRFYHSNRH